MMIANVSPASDQFDETLNTLKYADRAKRIRTKEAKSMRNSSRRRLLAVPAAASGERGSAATAAVVRAAERSAAAQKDAERNANERHMERMIAGRKRGLGKQSQDAAWTRVERQQHQPHAPQDDLSVGGGGVAARRQALARLNHQHGGHAEHRGPHSRMELTRHDSAALIVQRHARGRLARQKTQKLQAGDWLAMQGGVGDVRRRQALAKRAALSQRAGDVPAYRRRAR